MTTKEPRVPIILFVIVLSVAWFSCKDSKIQPGTQIGGGLIAETNHISYGEIGFGDIVNGNIRIWNGIDKTLKVTNIQTSCGCTKARLMPQTLNPGEEALLEVNISQINNLGESNEDILLELDSGDKAKLNVRGFLTNTIDISPAFVEISASLLEVEKEKIQLFEIVNTVLSGYNRRYNVSDIKPSSDFPFTITHDTSSKMETKHDVTKESVYHRISTSGLSMDDNQRPLGSFHSQFKIEIVDLEKGATLSKYVPVTMDIRHSIWAEPESLVLYAGGPAKTIYLYGESPFQIESWRIDTKNEQLEREVTVSLGKKENTSGRLVQIALPNSNLKEKDIVFLYIAFQDQDLVLRIPVVILPKPRSH